jgi:hypothetical protein
MNAVTETTKAKMNLDAELVWAASVAAHRANKGYIKSLNGTATQPTNRQLMTNMLWTATPSSTVDTKDIEEGAKIRKYFQSLTFKVIQGEKLSDYLTNLMIIANADKITNSLQFGFIASAIQSYNSLVNRDDADRKINWARGGFIGNVGDKTTQNIEIIKRIWSKNWGVYYYTGINSDDQVLFFSYKNELNVGDRVTITGKVKSHRDNSTQLSHVKVIS